MTETTSPAPLAPLTYAVAKRLLEAAVADKGADYLYPSNSATGDGVCRYVKNGVPSCLVGVVLAAHGVPLDVLAEADDGYDGGEGISAAANGTLRDAGLSIDINAVRLLAHAQARQDNGTPWGEAVWYAIDKTS